MSVVLWAMYDAHRTMIHVGERSYKQHIIYECIRNVCVSSDENWPHSCHYISHRHTKFSVMLYGISSDENWPHSCHYISRRHTKFIVKLYGISSDENWPQRYHCI